MMLVIPHDPRAVRALSAQVSSAGEALWQAGPERRARWLARAFTALRDPEHSLGQQARALVPQSAGLSEPMVRWALESALAPLTEAGLRDLDASVRPPHPGARRVRPGQLCVLVLAGNVFTAAARAVALPLLFGWPVLAKASSHDHVFPKLLEVALAESDAELAQAYRVVSFPGHEDARAAALFEQADAVSVYGSDSTLLAIRARLGASVTFLPHGHGLGAAFVGRDALADADAARRTAEALALDTAAYDQRGCMSPHVAWVARDAEVPLEAFAQLVHAAFDRLRVTLPRGQLPLDMAGAQVSWRGIGAMRGCLLEGDGFAVAYEDAGSLRVSPGYRNLQLLGIQGLDELPAKLAPLGVHLKCLGVSGVRDVEALTAALPARVAPRVCALGSMQSPPLWALHDGVPAWEGLLRWAER